MEEKEIMETEIELEEEREFVHCCNCDKLILVEDAEDFDGKPWCEDCLNEETTICNDCGERVYNDDAYGTSYGYYICDCCRDDYYYCDHCGDLLRDEHVRYSEYADGYFCENCYPYEDEYEEFNCVDYPMRDMEKGATYLGAELEVGSRTIGDYNIVYKIRDILGEKYLLNIHADGSVCEDEIHFGGEIVFQPLTIEEINSDDFRNKLNQLTELLYENDFEQKARTCGFHVHFTRFNNEDIAKLYLLSNFFRNEFKTLGARYDSHWCEVKYRSDNYITLKEQIPTETDRTRYVFWNRSNTDTIECRAFKSDLDVDVIIKRYNLVYRCALMSRTQKKNITFNYLLTGDETINKKDKVLSLDTLLYCKNKYKKEMELTRIKAHIKGLLHGDMIAKLNANTDNYEEIKNYIRLMEIISSVKTKERIVDYCKNVDILKDYITSFKIKTKTGSYRRGSDLVVGDRIRLIDGEIVNHTITNSDMMEGEVIRRSRDEIYVRVLEHRIAAYVNSEHWVQDRYFEVI